MKGNVVTVMKKELARVFKDKRTFFTSVFMPGILIYLIYSFMGTALTGLFTAEEDYNYVVYAVNAPESFRDITDALGFSIEDTSPADAESIKQQVADKEKDLLAVFTENFDEAVAAYDASSGEKAPQVELYYNTAGNESSEAYGMVSEALNAYESSLTNKFDLNGDPNTAYNLVSEKDGAGLMFSSMMPMLLMMFLFSGCMAVAPESIAGEKERGTIATILVTPVKRSEIAIGKIVALSVVSLLSGASSTIGTMLSMPKLMGGGLDGVDASVYGVQDYVMLALIILSTVLLLVTVIAVISAFAKTVKEAGTWVTPLMLLVMVVGITAMFGGGPQSRLALYLVPIYNSVQCMAAVFSFNTSIPAVLITVAMNLVLTGVGVFILTKMFNSEKVMFNR